jgi:surface protein
MFNYNWAFNGNISNWNVDLVEDMAHMFTYSPFNGNISNWNVASVKDMTGMFIELKCRFRRDHVLYVRF